MMEEHQELANLLYKKSKIPMATAQKLAKAVFDAGYRLTPPLSPISDERVTAIMTNETLTLQAAKKVRDAQLAADRKAVGQ